MEGLSKMRKYIPVLFFSILTYYKFYSSRHGEYWIAENLKISIWVLFSLFIIVSIVALCKTPKSIFIINPILCLISLFIICLKIMHFPIEFKTLFLYSVGLIISIFVFILEILENKRREIQ